MRPLVYNEAADLVKIMPRSHLFENSEDGLLDIRVVFIDVFLRTMS